MRREIYSLALCGTLPFVASLVTCAGHWRWGAVLSLLSIGFGLLALVFQALRHRREDRR